jgi:hypothetical protein
MGVVVGHDASAVPERRKLMEFVARGTLPGGHRLAIDPEPGDAAVGVDVEPEIVIGAIRRDRHIVMRARPQRHGGDDLAPVGVRARLGLAQTGVDGRSRGIVAGKVAGVDVEAVNDTLDPQPDDAQVMAAVAAAARLPAVHPFAMGVELVGNEHGRGILEQPLLGGEEVVTGKHCLGAQPRRCEVDEAAGEVRQIVVGGHRAPCAC